MLAGIALISMSHVLVIPPKPGQDATAAVETAFAKAGKGATIEFPKGEYHFFREKGFKRELYLSNSDVSNPRHISILIENRSDLKLQGNGSRLVFHDRVMPFAVLNSQKISIDGFTVDWDRPLMSQGTVLAYDSTGVTVKIDAKAFPYVIDNGKLFFTDTTWKRRPWGFMEFDPRSWRVAPGTGDAGLTDGNIGGATATEVEPGVVKLAYTSTRGPKVGHMIVFRHGSRDHAGTFILDSKDVSMSNMAFRHTSGLGVLAQYTENLTLTNVDVAQSRESGRVFAGHDDGFHISNCKGEVKVSGCRFEGLMDDPINVHGTCVKITKKVSPTVIQCRFMHDQSVHMRFGDVGDTVSFIDHESMVSRAKGTIQAIKYSNAEDFTVTLSKPIPESLNEGDSLENLTWTPSFTLSKSTFGGVRARGILISTPKKVVVQDCTFRSSGSAILIAGDSNGWYESGAVSDVTIRHNRFENCNTSTYQFCNGIISIYPIIPKPSPVAFHRNINIEGNTFITGNTPILWALSTDGLTFIKNRVDYSEEFPVYLKGASLSFNECQNVRVEGNRVDKRYQPRTIEINGGRPDTIKVKGW